MRAVEKKRPPLLTPKRWTLLVSLTLCALLVWFGFYFREVQLPKWTEEADAREAAMAAAELTEVIKVHKHIWDEVIWVTEGRNVHDESVFVFMRGDELLHIVQADEAVAYETIKESFMRMKPDASVDRIMPGIFRGGPAWEFHYKLEPDGIYYYDFYHFYDGSLLDSYRLPSKTGSGQ